MSHAHATRNPTAFAASAFAVEHSSNSKTGPVHATYAAQASCPVTCPLRGNGCYAEHGPMGIWTRKVNEAAVGATPQDVALAEADAIRETLSGRLDLRLHVVGDCVTSKAAAIVSEAACSILKRGREAWSYSHAWRTVERASWGEVSVLASCESAGQVKEAQDKGWATALVVSEFPDRKLYVEDGVKILPCPQQTTPGVTCAACRLCFDDTRLREKGITIGFEAHGARFKTVRRMLTVLDQ